MSMKIGAVLAAGVVAAGMVLCPAAHAMPGDPMPGCETDFLGTTFCDGPLRVDGTFQRCGYPPCWANSCAQVLCGIVNPAVGWPPLNPQHHIGG